MRFLITLLLAVSAAAQQFPPIPYKHRVLPNGLEVYSVQDRTTPTVAIHVWYRVGSKHDPEGRSGFAHLFEHIMFKSTKNMPSEMFDRLTEDVGGFNNATTFDDTTAYYEVVPSNYLQTLLWAEADRLGALNVDEANFKSERDVVKEEYRSHILAPPYGRLFYAVDVNSFTKHPYRRPGIGSIEQLDAATLSDVQNFHATFYRPDNAVLVVVGDFEQQQLDAWIDQYFTPIGKPAGNIPRPGVQEPARTAEKRVTEYAPNVPLPALAMTWLAPSASHDDTMALDVAAAILSEGESSRLRQKLVRGQIAQEVFAEDDSREDLGLFAVISIMGSGHKTAEAERVIRAEIAALANKPVPAAELEKAKNLLITGALRQRETNNGKAFALAQTIVIEHDPAQVNTALAQLQAVTPADVQRVVKTYLVEGKAVVIDYLDESEKKNAGGAQ
ncbi:MAG: insulinase family protein [Acidobacteriota bacterium]|nr:insulinase family protein [Acidobacteriota bacterium]